MRTRVSGFIQGRAKNIEGKEMNQADFDLLDRMANMEARLRALQAELERVVIDNHFLREENEVLRRNVHKPEVLR